MEAPVKFLLCIQCPREPWVVPELVFIICKTRIIPILQMCFKDQKKACVQRCPAYFWTKASAWQDAGQIWVLRSPQ